MTADQNAAIIIPARMASTRLPGKPLLDICGKPMIQHVVEKAKSAAPGIQVIVATDDEQILSCVEGFGGRAVLTRADHQSGSERVAEVAKNLDAQIIVNLQGDEPEIDPEYIRSVIDIQRKHNPFASTLVCPFPQELDVGDPSSVKAVLGQQLEKNIWQGLYFSRSVVPFQRGDTSVDRFLHLGIYAYSRESLVQFAQSPKGKLEEIEQLEQLRILEMGQKIAIGLVPRAMPGVDTQADLIAVRKRMDVL